MSVEPRIGVRNIPCQVPGPGMECSGTSGTTGLTCVRCRMPALQSMHPIGQHMVTLQWIELSLYHAQHHGFPGSFAESSGTFHARSRDLASHWPGPIQTRLLPLCAHGAAFKILRMLAMLRSLCSCQCAISSVCGTKLFAGRHGNTISLSRTVTDRKYCGTDFDLANYRGLDALRVKAHGHQSDGGEVAKCSGGEQWLRSRSEHCSTAHGS